MDPHRIIASNESEIVKLEIVKKTFGPPDNLIGRAGISTGLKPTASTIEEEKVSLVILSGEAILSIIRFRHTSVFSTGSSWLYF